MNITKHNGKQNTLCNTQHTIVPGSRADIHIAS